MIAVRIPLKELPRLGSVQGDYSQVIRGLQSTFRVPLIPPSVKYFSMLRTVANSAFKRNDRRFKRRIWGIAPTPEAHYSGHSYFFVASLTRRFRNFTLFSFFGLLPPPENDSVLLFVNKCLE